MSNVSTVQSQQEAHRDALAAHREDCAQRPQSQHISPLLSYWLDDAASDEPSAEAVLPAKGQWGHHDTTEFGARYGWDFEQSWRGLHDHPEPPAASPAPGGPAQLSHFINQLESSFGENFSHGRLSDELPERAATHAEDAAAELEW